MTGRLSPPVWLTTWLWVLGGLLTGVGVLCLTAPHVLFGSDGYRTGGKLVIGLLGAALLAVGPALPLALRTQDPRLILVQARVTFLGFAIAPPVMMYNIGALDGIMALAGLPVLLMLGLFVLLFGPPLVLLLRWGGKAQISEHPAGSPARD